jgi:hypothetical protein
MTARRRGILVALLALAVILTVVIVRRDDDSDTSTATSTTTTTTATTTIATTTTTTAAGGELRVWPPAGESGADDPTAAARAFALDLGFVDPVIGPFQQGDARSGEIAVQPVADGPVTTVLVRQLSSTTGWSVLGAATANIELTSPAFGDVIGPTLELDGRALAFEGTVHVDVFDLEIDEPIGSGFVTGGGDVPRPFHGELDVAIGSGRSGAIVLRTSSADDGRTWEVAAIAVRLQDD